MAREKDKQNGVTGVDTVSVSVVFETDLVAEVNRRARELDLNRSQYLRRLAKRDLELAARGKSPLAKAA